jgi:regulator of RNase E activity RraA
VIVIEQRTGVNAACWGGLLTLAAKLRGVAGVIAEGLVRDIDEAVGHGFSIYARGLTAQTARGRIVETATDAPVEIGEVHVRAGDYVAADGSAAVFIEAGVIERVLETAEAITVKEAEMAEALIRGASVSEVLSAVYENMLKS